MPFFLSLATVTGARNAADASFEELVEQSQFVFKGTVTKVTAATLPQIRPTANTVIVTVDEVLAAPTILENYKSKDITVHVNRPGAVKVGDQFVFFTTSWMFGSSIAVREVGRTEPNSSTTRARITDALERSADNKLQNRMASAELVVAGRVSAARLAPEHIRRGSISEHYPDWREAVIQIDSFLKGQQKERSVVVLFPTSNDVMWERTPKFREGQEGIWILRRADMRTTAPGQEYFTALDPLDFHSHDQLDRIRRLVR